LKPPRRERRLHLVLELRHEQGEVERLRDASQHRASLLGQPDRCLEQLLHPQRGAHLDHDERLVVARVREVVAYTGRDDDRFTWSGDDPLAADSEAHRAVHDLEPLLLQRVDMQASRYPTPRWKRQLDGQQFAVRLRGRFAERDPLSTRGVRQCLSWISHIGLSIDLASRPVSACAHRLSMIRKREVMLIRPDHSDA